MSKHRPGPWERLTYNKSVIIEKPLNDNTITFVVCEVKPSFDKEVEDDTAKIIAAAPEMYEALKYAVEMYDKKEEPLNIIPLGYAGWLERARAAINKAEGNTEDD